MRSFVNCSYRFAACDVLTKVHLQECFPANNSKTKPDIDVISAQECVSRCKDAEKCEKSQKEKFLHLQACCTQRTTDKQTRSVSASFANETETVHFSRLANESVQ